MVRPDGSRRVVLAQYSQPEISRVPMPPQLRNRPRSQLLAQHAAESWRAKRLSKATALPKPGQDECKHLIQDTSSAAVPVDANNPAKRLSSTSRRRSLLARSRASRSTSPIKPLRLQGSESDHSSPDFATTDVIANGTETVQTLRNSTCQMNPIEQVTEVEREPPCLISDPSVPKSPILHGTETCLDTNLPSKPAMPLSPASVTTPMSRPLTAISEDSRVSMASSKFSLGTFPLPPSQLPPLPRIPTQRPTSEASNYPRSEASTYSCSSLAQSIRSGIMSRPHSIYRKAVKALPKDPQYFLDILDEHMDVPPPVPLKVRPSSAKTMRTINTAISPAPLGPPPPVPSPQQATAPHKLRIQTSFEEQPSPAWEGWDDFETILNEFDDTYGDAERRLSQLTAASDFQSKSSVTGDYLHHVERIRSQNSSPATSVSSVASALDMNKALPSPPISEVPELDHDSSTEGSLWSPHPESQPATPLLRSIMRKTLAKHKSQHSDSHPVAPPPRSYTHIAHCVIEPPPRNPARRTKHQVSSSLGSSVMPLISESARTSPVIGIDQRRIVSYAPSSTGGGFGAHREKQFDGISFYDARSRTPSPEASIVPGLEGGYF